jgi:hypothetical protein
MGDPAPKYRRAQSVARTVGPFVGVYGGLLAVGPFLFQGFDRLHDWWWRGLGPWPTGTALHRVIDLLGHGLVGFSVAAYVCTLLATLLVVPLGLVLRSSARARVRAGMADPLDRVRSWVAAHPRLTRALTVAPPALWSLAMATLMKNQYLQSRDFFEQVGTSATMGLVGVFATLALTPFSGAALRAFLVPTLADRDVPQRAEIPKNEISFAAVAVTPETSAAVLAMMALSAVAMAVVLSTHRSMGDPKLLEGLVLYAAVAMGGAALFRHASQVAIGVDGVLVKGTSRTRFFAYRDLDAATAGGMDLVLHRKGRIVLRLQLHGDDASKRDAVLARIREAIACVKEGRGAVSAQMVSGATAEQLVHAAAGGADYRGAALTRDQLWALVEGPEVDASARQAAAEALAKTGDEGERKRLRVAAEHCASPEVRVAIERLAGDEVEEGGRAAVALARRSA